MKKILAWTLILLLGGSSNALAAAANDAMTVHIINVGQGDAALLEFSCGAILLDTGAQDDASQDHLLHYLDDFFKRRSDLNRTLKSIIITHPHIDHTRALMAIAERFKVEGLIDDGLDKGSGIEPVRKFKSDVKSEGQKTFLRSITQNDFQTSSQQKPSGLSDVMIDPVACKPTDPQIRLLSGGYTQNPGFTHRQFEDANNHSLVVRIDFGKASFLFTGDLEKPAIDRLVRLYHGTSMLDVDVYHVGHHGSHNGTTKGLLQAMTPKAAVISMGRWDYGVREKKHPYTTFKFGHPRKVVIDLLNASLSQNRSVERMAKVAVGSKKFVDTTIQKAIYATAWDGDIRITAKPDGTLNFE